MKLLTDIELIEKDGTRGFYVPWLPEKLEFSSGGISAASYDVMGRGPVEIPTGSGLREISWSGTFPGINRTDLGMLRGGSLRSPQFYHAILEDWRRNGTVVTLALYAYPFINLDVVLVEYSGSATGGFGDWEYTVKFKEKRDLGLKLITPKKEDGSSPDASEEPKRDVPAENTYTIKNGDCLWNIAQQHLGSGLRWTELYDLNYDALEAEAQKYGTHCTKNFPVIYTGTTIKLPAS